MIVNSHPATSRQIEYIIELAKHHGTKLPADDQIADWTQYKASEIISWYLDKFGPLPRRSGAPTLKADREVKAGHYAIEFEGQLRFFKVDTPDEGRGVRDDDDLGAESLEHGRCEATCVAAAHVEPVPEEDGCEPLDGPQDAA